MKKVKYSNGDIQYFEKGILVKTIILGCIIIDYTTTPKTVTLKK